MGIRDWRKENKGITLISLIIIIIILLILTGIIVMASYNDGVINKADESSDQYDIGKEKEYLKLAFTHFQMNYMEKGIGFTNEEYKEELNKYIDSVEIGDATDEDKEKYGIEIDFQESLGGYMKITFKVTNNSYVVARIKNKNNTEPVGPDIPEKKTYTVTYNANGGENAPIVQTKTEGRSLTLSTQIPNRNGYTFKGWSIIQNSEVTYNPGGTFDRDMNTTLYAVWQINTYTITYDLNGGTLLSQNPGSYTVETDTITLNNPSKEGYMFLGWTGSNGEIPQRTVKIEKGTTENKEYTAVYGEGNYRVNGTYYIDLEEAINACENNVETTIEVLKNCDDLFENNNIENKNIILNLGNNTLNLSKTINVKSGSSLKIIGEGKIQNQSDVAISVEGTLIIGENDATVGKTPIIEGTTFGISTSSGKLYFYDGQIIGNKAINGEITKLPESYTALSKTENSKEVVYLDIVADAVARIGYKYFTTLQAAVDTVQSGIDNQVEIIMVDNATVSSAVTISDTKNIKLNLDGHTIQASGNTYVLDNSGKLEIVDTSSAQTGTIDNSAYRAIKNQKELILTNGTISIGAGTSSNYQRGIDNTETGIFTMNGGTIKSDKNYTRMIFNDNGKVYVNNGTITASSTSGQGIFNGRDGYIEVNGGNITVGQLGICNTSDANCKGTIQINGGIINFTNIQGIYNGSIGTVNIAGGTITGTASYVINQNGNGVVNITGGVIKGVYDVIYITNGKINIENGRIEGTERTVRLGGKGEKNLIGGTIIGNNNLVFNESGETYIKNMDLIAKNNNDSIYNTNTGTVTISNSKIKGINNKGILLVRDESVITAGGNYAINSSGTVEIGEKIQEGTEETPKDNPIIEGGQYGVINSDGNLCFYDGIIKGTTNAVKGGVNILEEGTDLLISTLEGYEIATLTTELQPIAKIGEDLYYSLNDAIQAVSGTEETTINILRDITLRESSTIPEDKNIVIDLNGNNIEALLKIQMINKGNLKITDSKQTGSFILNIRGSNSYVAGIVNEDTGILTIDNNVTISGTGYNFNVINNAGTVNVTNANIKERSQTTGSYANSRIIYNTGTAKVSKSILGINGSGSTSKYGIYNAKGTVNVEDITVEGSGEVIYNDTGEVNITGTNVMTGGTFITGRGEGTIKIVNSDISLPGNIRIGGAINTIIENSTLTISSYSNYDKIEYSGSGNLEIKDSNITTIDTCTTTTYGGIRFSSTGTLKITGETSIDTTGKYAILNNSTGTIILGENDGEVDKTYPCITGGKYGIYQSSISAKLNFYDGVVIGSNDYDSIYQYVTKTEEGYEVVKTIDEELKTSTARLEQKTVVAQIGANQYYTLNDAVQSIQGTEETTINILRDIEILSTMDPIEIAEDKNIVIDLNGNNIESAMKSVIINKGNLRITDNQQKGSIIFNLPAGVNSDYTIGLINESTGRLTIDNNVKILGKGLYYYNIISNAGILNITNVTIDSKSSSNVNNSYSRIIYNTGTIEISNSVIGINVSGGYRYGIYNAKGIVNVKDITEEGSGEVIYNDTGEVNVTGTNKVETGTFIVGRGTGGTINIKDSNSTVCNALEVKESTEVTIENSTLTKTIYGTVIEISGSSNLNIKDSNIIQDYSKTTTVFGDDCCIKYNSTGTLKITGESTITSAKSKGIYNGSTGSIIIDQISEKTKKGVTIKGETYGIYNSSTGTVTLGENDSEVDRTYPCITGGTYGIYQSNSNGKLNFYDGQVKGKIGTIYGTITEIASGYEISKTNGDYYTDILVKSGVEVSVAKIGEVTYTSIQDAIAACPEGTQKTITIENNVIATSTITIPQGKDIILDLNGFTIIGENVDNVIENNGTLTILDGLNRGGKIENTSGTAIGGNGTLTVDSSATIVNGN